MAFINKKEKKQRSNNTAKRKERMNFYNLSKWKKLRMIKLVNNPECEVCAKNNIITLATEVHHITSFMTGIDYWSKLNLLLDYNNLLSVCEKCHGDIHGGKINYSK